MTVKAACRLLGLSRATYYRRLRPPAGRPDPVPQRDRYQPAALAPAERRAVLARLSDEGTSDLAVAQLYWRLMDAGGWIASLSSWYRIAREARLSGDRRRQATHPPKTIPVLHATGPNQVWSWDITDLASIDRGRSFKLYVILDVFSRCVVAWRVEERESSTAAVELFLEAITCHTVPQVLHADRGSVMTGKAMTGMLHDYAVIQSHSRPHVSNDNPFSEAQFKTAKYSLGYPIRFHDIDDARAWTTLFIHYYNAEHHHSGIGNYTPLSVHNGTWTTIREHRQATLDTAYQAHPERFRRPPIAPTITSDVWINDPTRMTPTSQTG